MDKENQRIAKKIRAILRKKEEENRALLKLIRAVTKDRENVPGDNRTRVDP